jgi:hypothetical protein
MSSTIQPNAQYTFGPANGGGDIIHFVNSLNQPVAWIDTNGVHWGTHGTVALVTAPNQTASISTATLYSVPGVGAGMYAVYADVITVSAGSAGTVTVNVSWNNGTTSAGLNSSAFTLTAQGEQAALLGNFMVAANTTITYSTTVSGATGNPQYTLNLRLVYLG